MLRSVITGSFLIALLAIYDVSDAQVRNIAPFLGASGSFGSIDNSSGYGWGIEGGVRFFSFYGGLEYGTYYKILPFSQTDDPVAGSTEFTPTSVKYWGIHVGHALSDSGAYLGLVLLHNNQMGDTAKTFLDFGLDIRFPIIHNVPMDLACAFTYRRGLKLGLDYMF